MTASIGVASNDGLVKNTDDLLRHADMALYAAKRDGRDRVCRADEAGILTEKPDPTNILSDTHDDQIENTDRLKIVVLDSNDTTRTLCRKLLEQSGYEVFEATDGPDGMELVRENKPAVVLIEVSEPALDGVACVRQLKNDVVARDISVIVVSARSNSDEITAAMQAGADEYVAKPFKHRELIYRVRSMSRLYQSKSLLNQSNTVRATQAQALAVTLELTRHLAGAIDLDKALEHILSAAAELTSSRRISIMLPDENDEHLVVAKAIGLNEEVARCSPVPIGNDVAGQVYRSCKPIQNNSGNPEDWVHGEHYKSKYFVSTPLVYTQTKHTHRPIGVLNITERQNGQPYHELDFEYIDLIGNIAASAIEMIQNRKARDKAHASIVTALAKLAEHRDSDTGRHLDRVSRFSVLLATELGCKEQFRGQIDETFLRDLELAVPLHDIGKVAIPDSILLKPGRLSAPEMAIMKTHVDVGAQTIRAVMDDTPNVSFIQMAVDIVQYHHEWFDGSGYPCGIKGEEIPLSARIASLADVYDALTTHRAYKPAYSHEKTMSIIRSSAGTQFDPIVIEALIQREDEFIELARALADDMVGEATRHPTM